MERERVFRDFDPKWIVHEDDALLAIDKPEGVPSQAADPERPDDILTRLRRFLVQRGSDPYLGSHQRLDRDTSGLLVFTRDRGVNASIAQQFEGRSVKKRYLAGVDGWAKGRDRVTLDDVLAPGKDGRMEVARGAKGGGKRARTHVHVIERRGSRALLELELETGRTHQARVQLAHAGAPIAGDVLYGGSPAPRLMLHASALELVHPRTNRRLELVTSRPADLDEWLSFGDRDVGIYDDPDAVRRALQRALERRYGLGRSEGPRHTTAFRLVNEGGDGLPRLAVDVYGEHLVLQLYGDDGPWASAERRERVLDLAHELGFEGVYLKVRPKQANLLVDTRRAELAPLQAVRGASAPEEVAIVEEGIEYLVRLGDGLSTGIFLDQRGNRARVRAMAAEQTVLNLFSYTCGFSIAAAVGGAKRTVSVDASAAALERGRAGFLHLGLDLAQHAFVGDDAFAYLARATHKRERFDLVILDPPSYSSTKSRRFVAESDYGELAALVLPLVARGGRLVACTNHRGIRRERFRRVLHEAVRKAGRTAKQIKDLPDPLDYPAAPGAESHLKSALVTLSD